MKARQSLSLLMALMMLLAINSRVLAQSDEEVTPDVRISPTGIIDGRVIIARAVADGPAWVVIHADDGGAPGEVLGYAPLEEGENNNVLVEIDAANATPILHAMLHEDEGEVGTYEFPGPDVPIEVAGNIVMAAFSAEPVPAETAPMTPDVQVSPEGVVDGRVTIARATTEGPSWVVIHADDNGAPGEVIGYAPLNTGENSEVIVEIDEAAVTPTLHAMLHDDRGEEGVYEFPGPDSPTELDGNIVMAAFSAQGTPTEMSDGTGGPVSEAAGDAQVNTMSGTDSAAKGAAAPAMLPQTGGAMPTGTVVIVVMGLLVLLAGGTFIMRRSRSGQPG